MKLLIKFPSRNRPDQFLSVLEVYAKLCRIQESTTFLITLDTNDATMIDKDDKIHEILQNYNHKIIRDISHNKIHAINRDMEHAGDWDILLLASDDMVPEVEGYDQIIRSKMNQHYPHTDGVLWFNDGYTADKLNTLVCMGRKYYNRFNYIYNPAYKSFFCDNEFMDVANELKRQTYFPECIIRHQHPANTGKPTDVLYTINDRYWKEDQTTYVHAKKYEFDLSILICSLVSRRKSLHVLMKQLMKARQVSKLRIEILTDIDKGEKSIGQKRNDLVARSKGKYCCFIDDDDEVTLDYIKEIETCLQSNPDCVSMIGMYYKNGVQQKPFVHSLSFRGYSEDGDAYYRPPNHLNPILTEYVKKVPFPLQNHGEDTDFAMRLAKSNLLMREARVSRPIYLYYYKDK